MATSLDGLDGFKRPARERSQPGLYELVWTFLWVMVILSMAGVCFQTRSDR
jgi:hypothetical protein